MSATGSKYNLTMLRMPQASTNGMPQAPTFCGGFLQTRFIVESHQVACAERTCHYECKQRLARCDYSIMILDIRVRHLDNPLRLQNGPPRHCTMKIEGELHYFLAVARQEVYFVQSHLVHLLAMNKFELPPRDNNDLRLGPVSLQATCGVVSLYKDPSATFGRHHLPSIPFTHGPIALRREIYHSIRAMMGGSAQELINRDGLLSNVSATQYWERVEDHEFTRIWLTLLAGMYEYVDDMENSSRQVVTLVPYINVFPQLWHAVRTWACHFHVLAPPEPAEIRAWFTQPRQPFAPQAQGAMLSNAPHGGPPPGYGGTPTTHIPKDTGGRHLLLCLRRGINRQVQLEWDEVP